MPSAAITTGYVIPFGGIQIIPEFSVDGLYLRESTHAEQGAGAEDLFIADEDHFFDVFLRDGEHEYADLFGCEGIRGDAAGRAIHRAAGI